ncbi:MAG: hypothetical protein FJZ58_05495 [Chlamydiae bacterium]|nr:hypothetical protein [Chlamydiota bacterium]
MKVILIPTKDEFRLAGLKTAVWWNAFEIGGRHPEKLLAKRDIACIRQNNRICLAEVGCIQEVAGLTLPSEKASQERAIQANSGKLFQIEVAV